MRKQLDIRDFAGINYANSNNTAPKASTSASANKANEALRLGG